MKPSALSKGWLFLRPDHEAVGPVVSPRREQEVIDDSGSAGGAEQNQPRGNEVLTCEHPSDHDRGLALERRTEEDAKAAVLLQKCFHDLRPLDGQ
jgi:hypothetical protein